VRNSFENLLGLIPMRRMAAIREVQQFDVSRRMGDAADLFQRAVLVVCALNGEDGTGNPR
jgi:hypothetical protein